jgi:hypothetical protein
MMFWFKRKEIVIDCFVANRTIHEAFTIAPANKFFPDGWKTMPKTKNIKVHKEQYPDCELEIELPTIKKCVGLIELFTTGFIIPSWVDFGIEINKDGKHMWCGAGDIIVDQHPAWQLWEGLYDGYGHAKIASPWLIKEKTGIKFSWNECDWHNTHNLDKFRILSGVTNFKFQHQTNINLFLKRNSTMYVKAGSPLVHIIPITENSVKIKTHLVTDVEMKALDRQVSQYSGHFKTMKKSILESEKELSKSKCPFGFR